MTLYTCCATLLLSLTLLGGGCTTTERAETLPYPTASLEDDPFAVGSDLPPTGSTLYRLGKLLVAQEKPAEAEHVFASGIDRYPDYLPTYAALADLYVRHHRLDRAQSLLLEGLQIASSDPVLLNDLGMCYLLQDRTPQALEQFTRAAKAAPHDPRIRANRALAMGLLGRYDDALQEYQHVGDRGTAHFNVAVICQARGDHERAAEEFTHARTLGVKEE